MVLFIYPGTVFAISTRMKKKEKIGIKQMLPDNLIFKIIYHKILQCANKKSAPAHRMYVFNDDINISND